MATFLKFNKIEECSKMHLMPCKIKTDSSDVPIDKYFETVIRHRTDDSKVLDGSFRGYPINGKEVSIPENYKGYVFIEKTEKLSETNKDVYAEKKFDKITYWNYDKCPTSVDRINQVLNWPQLSAAIHSPVKE